MKKIIFLIISLFFFTGCYDYNELNDLAIVSGMAVSYEEEKYETTFEIIIAKKSSSNEQEDSKAMLVSSSGKTPAEAINNTIGKVDKTVIFSHVQMVLLDENIAKHGISDFSNYLFREIHIRNNFNYVLAKDCKAKEILQTKIKNEPVVTNALLDMFNNQNNVEMFDLQSEFDYLYATMKDGKEDIVLPSITLKNEKLGIGTLGYFKKDKLKGYLSKNESQTFFLLIGSVENALYTKENTAISIYKNDASIKAKNNKIYISLDAQGLIKTLEEKDSLRTANTNKKVSKEITKVVKKDIKNLVKKSMEVDSDFLGIQTAYYRKYPDKYKKNIYKTLDYEYNISVEVNRNGQAFEVMK